MGTLWLLHYLVSSNERYVVWNRLVNRVIPENDRSSTAIVCGIGGTTPRNRKAFERVSLAPWIARTSACT